MKVTVFRTSIDFRRHLKEMPTKEYCKIQSTLRIPVQSEQTDEYVNEVLLIIADKFRLSNDYDILLRKKPTLAMFYNCLERPRQSQFTNKRGIYYKQFTQHKKEWDAAEKQVLFRPELIKHGYPSETEHTIDFVLGDGTFVIRFDDNENVYAEVNGGLPIEAKTLEMLANITNSALLIKNVTL